MGRIGEEITLKVKSAVKAKLIELGIEIDNELPDYIMVLVANKKTEEQMERDLQLFLGSNTVIFCSWLMNVLKKLEEVTVSNRNRKDKETLKVKQPKQFDDMKTEPTDPSILKKIKKEEDMETDDIPDSDCLETRITAQEGLLVTQEEVDTVPVVLEKSVEPMESLVENVQEKRESVALVETRLKVDEGRKRRSRSKQRNRTERSHKRSHSPRYDKDRSRNSGQRRSGSRHRNDRGRSSSCGSPRRSRRSPGSRSRYKDYDPRPLVKSRVTQGSPSRRSSPERKRSRLLSSSSTSKGDRLASLVQITSPPPRQTQITANSKLLLKAVADAEKSVSSAERKFKRDLSKNKEASLQKEQQQTQKENNNLYLPPEKLFVTLQNSSNKGQNDDSLRAVRRNNEYRLGFEEELVDDCLDFEVDDDEEYVPEPLVKSNVARPSYIPSCHGYSLLDLETTRFIVSPERSLSPWHEEEANRSDWKKDRSLQEVTKTIVTTSVPVLRSTVTPSYRTAPYNSRGRGGRGGFQSRFKLSHIPETSRNLTRAGLWERLGPPPTATVRPMPVTNTTSPSAANAADPEKKSSQDLENLKLEAMNKALERCKFWPDCTDNGCVYYHPTSPCKIFPACKYGMQCLFVHPDCKFGSDCQNPTCNFSHKNSVKGGYPLLCVYYPNCTNPFCKFRHPAKPCRFGAFCERTGCFYSHPPKPVIPPKELLSWKAPEKV